MRKLLIVGAGGIGSWLAYYLHDLQTYDQLKNLDITLADPDTVDTKNISYQNFKDHELFDNKAEALNMRYSFKYISEKITEYSQLSGFDAVVSAVDNTSFRKLIFNKIPNNEFYWIDLRSEGNQVSAYTKGADKQDMLDSVAVDMEEQSCQRRFELENGIIQQGNKIIAAIGSQYILNWYRGDMNKKSFNTVF